MQRHEVCVTNMNSSPPADRDADDDCQLLQRYLQMGDPDALDVLFRRHADAAYRSAHRVCGNASDAEDAVQTAFLQVLRQAAQYRGQSSVRGWIMSIVINAARLKIREEVRRRERQEQAAPEDTGAAPPQDEHAETLSAVARTLAGLPQLYRLPLSLHFMEHLTFQEVACALAIPEKTVRSQISRGLEQLRDALAAAGFTSLALPELLVSLELPAAPVALKASFTSMIASATAGGAGVGTGATAAQGSLATTVAAVALCAVALAAGLGAIVNVYHTGGGTSVTPAAQGSAPAAAPARLFPPNAFFVDANHPEASDAHPGQSEERPWKTISRAVRNLQPGAHLYIKAGEYREAVALSGQGTAAQPITIAAYPGDEGNVWIKGSDLVTDWRPDGSERWSTPWPHTLKAEYPSGWPQPGGSRVYDFEYIWRVELAFVDGEPLRQVTRVEQLVRGAFWVDDPNRRLVVVLPDGSVPAAHRLELSVRQAGLTVSHSHFISLTGLTVAHVANSYQTGAISLLGGGDYTLKNNRACWNNLAGFMLSCNRVRFSSNRAEQNGGPGIAGDTSHSVLEENTTDDNSWRFGPDWECGGLCLTAGSAGATDVAILGHCARNNNGPGITIRHGQNFRIGRCLLDRNVVYGLGLFASLGGNIAASNIICRTRSYAGAQDPFTGVGVLLDSVLAPQIHQNTIVQNERYGLLIAGGMTRQPPYPDCWPAETQVFQNIVAENGAGGICFRVRGEYAAPQQLKTHRFERNLWYHPKGFLAAYPGPQSQLVLKTLAEWQQTWEQDAYALEADPLFVNAGALDFRLSPASPALKKGQTLPRLKLDFAGVRRGAEPDLGALESSR